MGRSYACRLSDGTKPPVDSQLVFSSGQLQIDGAAGRRSIDLLNIDAFARQDVKIGLRIYPSELLVVERLGRDYEIFYEEVRAERRKRLLTGLFLQDVNPSKVFPCVLEMGNEQLDAEVEIYPTSLLFYPVAVPPFPVPLSYVRSQEFDPGEWSLTITLIEGTKLKLRKLAKLTDEFRTRLDISMANHGARTERLSSLLRLKSELRPGLPMSWRQDDSTFLTHPCIIRREEATYLSGLGETYLCLNELNIGLRDSDDTHAIPPDDALIANSVIYLMTEMEKTIVVEVLNQVDYATYSFKETETPPLYPNLSFEKRFLMHLIRAFDSINFRREPVYEEAAVLESRMGVDMAAIERKNPSVAVLRRAFAGRAIHTSAWRNEVERMTAR